MSQLYPEDIRVLIRLFGANTVSFQKNEVLPRVQDKGQLNFLLEGIVYLCAENEQFQRGILRFFRPNECFAPAILLPPGYGVSYLLAKYPVRAACFQRGELLQFALGSPSWWEKLHWLEEGQQEQELLAQAFLLHQRSIRSRLLRFLQEECRIQRSSSIRIPIPYADLADYLAIERTAMMRELKKLREEGILSGKQRNLRVNLSF